MLLKAACSVMVASGSLCIAHFLQKRYRHAHLPTEQQAELKVFSVQSGLEVDVVDLLESAKNQQQWIVACDDGPYRLVMGEFSIGIDSRFEEDFGIMLSHRWHPTVDTVRWGSVPTPVFAASYPEATWVDFLNHFNIDVFSQRVLSKMGKLYSTKRCRAIYFESGTDLKTAAASCTRSWMWQELSVGPQCHSYASVDRIWLHAVVNFGEQAMQDILIDWLDAAQLLSGLLWRQRIEGRRELGLLASSWRGLRTILQDFSALVILHCSQMEQYHIAIDDEIIAEFDAGDLVALLTLVLSKKGYAHCDEFVRLVVRDVQGEACAVSAVIRLINQMAVTGLQCIRLCDKAKGVVDRNTQLVMTFLSIWTGCALALQGCRPASAELAMAAVRMKQREGWLLSSAAANLSNRNLTFDSDRLAASFGVLCSSHNVPCDARHVSQLLYSSTEVRVPCLPAAEAHGVIATMRRAAVLSTSGVRWSSGLGQSVLSIVSECMLHSVTEYDAVELSGLRLGPCQVLVLMPLTQVVASAVRRGRWRHDGRPDGEVHVSRWSIRGDGRLAFGLVSPDETVTLLVDALEVGDGVRQRLASWHQQLPLALDRRRGNVKALLERAESLHSRFPHPQGTM